MKVQRVIYRYFVFTIIIIIQTHIIACTNLVTIRMDSPRLESDRLLHVELTSGQEIKVKDHRIEDGFLLGKTPKYHSLSGPYVAIKISLDQIKLVRVERFSSKKTVITIAVITFAVGMFFYYVSQLDLGLN